ILEYRYITRETDTGAITEDVDELLIAWNDLEFHGEAAHGEAFPVSPSDIVSKRKERDRYRQYAVLATLMRYWRVRIPHPMEPPRPRPPVNAEYLLYLLLPKADQDCEIGDLVERYGRLVQRFNKR